MNEPKIDIKKLRKEDNHINRMFQIQDLLPHLIATHRNIYELLEQCIDTNKKDFDITLNNRRFVSTIPFTKEEAKILKKQRRSFLRYVMSTFYKGLIKGKENPFLILDFFTLANPKDYAATKSKKLVRLSKEEKIALERKKGEYNASALKEIEDEVKYRQAHPELYNQLKDKNV